MLHPNFENVTSQLWNVISELWKRYIRTLKTLCPNFENVISELWKRYIPPLKTLHPNFEKGIFGKSRMALKKNPKVDLLVSPLFLEA